MRPRQLNGLLVGALGEGAVHTYSKNCVQICTSTSRAHLTHSRGGPIGCGFLYVFRGWRKNVWLSMGKGSAESRLLGVQLKRFKPSTGL
jgi:hypothetical protein